SGRRSSPILANAFSLLFRSAAPRRRFESGGKPPHSKVRDMLPPSKNAAVHRDVVSAGGPASAQRAAGKAEAEAAERVVGATGDAASDVCVSRRAGGIARRSHPRRGGRGVRRPPAGMRLLPQCSSRAGGP